MAMVRNMFQGLSVSLAPPPADEGVYVDTVIIDAPPAAIEVGPTPSAKIEIGRMVGADRGRLSDIIDFYGEGDEKKLPN